MLLPRFEYYEPATLEETCDILDTLKEKAGLLAGGTDLLVNMKKGVHSPEHVLSLARVEEMRELRREKGQLALGATMTATDLEGSPEINHDFVALSKGAGSIGSPLIQNLATIGGNLISARPAADLPPNLLVYAAKVVLQKKGGQRTLNIEDFFKGPGKTTKEPEEVLTKILLKTPPNYSGGGYVKLGKRKALEISIVNVAAFLSLESPDGAIREARIALGAVAPIPMRAKTAEGLLKGEKPGEALFRKAGEEAAKESKPINDFRGSAAYRRDMVSELTKRALSMAFEEARAREWRRWQ